MKVVTGISATHGEYYIIDTDTWGASAVKIAEADERLKAGEKIYGLKESVFGICCTYKSPMQKCRDILIGRCMYGSLYVSLEDKILYWMTDETREKLPFDYTEPNEHDIPDIECSIDCERNRMFNSKLAMMNMGYGIDCFGNILYKGADTLKIPEATQYIISNSQKSISAKRLESVHGAVIGESAFLMSSLEEVIIKSDKVGRHAFHGCTGLRSVKILNGTKEVSLDAFNQTPIKEIVLPRGTVAVHNGVYSDIKIIRR